MNHVGQNKVTNHVSLQSQTLSAYYANLDGELGTAHHFNDVEGCPADVIAQHLELHVQDTINKRTELHDSRFCVSRCWRERIIWDQLGFEPIPVSPRIFSVDYSLPPKLTTELHAMVLRM